MFTSKLYLTLFLAFWSVATLFSQTKDSDKPEKLFKQPTQLAIRLTYINDAVFAGRTDSVKVPYLHTSATYSHKSGFFLKGSVSYLLSANEERIDIFTTGLGYQWQIKNFAFNLAGVKYFFNEESSNVQSQIQGYLSASIDYTIKNTGFLVDLTRYFNDENTGDFFMGTELNQSFYLFKNHIMIQPAVYFEFGTQSYYESYYQNSVDRSMQGNMGNGNPQPSPTTSSTLSITESRKFQLLNIEFSSSFAYTLGRFRLSVIPTYAMPMHPATVTIDNEVFEEDLEPFLYWYASIRYRIYL
jgi:hypothetical protein